MGRFTKKADKDKVEKIPTKIYSFGAIMPKESREVAEELLFLAHRHKNRLIEMERGCLQEKWDFLRTLSEDYAKACDAHDVLEAKKQSLIDQAKKIRILRQTKVDDPTIKREINAVKRKIKKSFATMQTMRSKLYKTDEFQAWQNQYKSTKKELDAKARADSGLYWGIYNMSAECVASALKAKEGAKPDFRRYNHEGRFGVQVQGGGLFRDACPGGKAIATLLQIDDPYQEYVDRSTAESEDKKGKWRNARIRIGSDANRKPIWLEFRVALHRAVPEHTSVKGAWLVAKRTGNQVKWQFQVELNSKDWEEKPLGEDTLAVGLGWKVVADGLQVATLLGTDGHKSHIVIPNDILNRITKARDIQSIRDQRFDEFQDHMVAWLKTAEVPEWLTEKTENLACWRSNQRLARVVRFWKNNRFDKDSGMFLMATAWAEKENHLYAYQSHITNNFWNWRQNFYRKTASDLAKKYGHILFNDLKLAEKAKKDPVGENDDPDYRPPLWRDLPRQAGLSYLTTALKERFPFDKYTHDQLHADTCGACGKPWPDDKEGKEHCGLTDHKESLCLLMLRQYLDEPSLARFFKARGIVDLVRIGGKKSKTKTETKTTERASA